MNRLPRRLMLLPLIALAVGTQLPGVQAVASVPFDRFDVLFTSNDNKIVKWDPDGGAPQVVFDTSASNPGGLVTVTDDAGDLAVLMGDAAPSKGILCCRNTTAGPVCETVPGSATAGGVGGISGAADGSVLLVNSGGSTNQLKRLVKSTAPAAVCGFVAETLDASVVSGGQLRSVRAASAKSDFGGVSVDLGAVLILTDSMLVRWNGENNTPTTLITNFGGQTPMDFAAGPEGGLLVATSQGNILHYSLPSTSPDAASWATLQGAGKRIAVGLTEAAGGGLGEIQVCVSITSGSTDVECFRKSNSGSWVSTGRQLQYSGSVEGVTGGAGGSGALATFQNATDLTVLATQVVFENGTSGSVTCEYFKFPHPGGADALGASTVPGFLLSAANLPVDDGPGSIPGTMSIPDNFVPLGALNADGSVRDATAPYVLWKCESNADPSGIVKTKVIEEDFGIDPNVLDCDGAVVERPRLCKNSLVGEAVSPSPETSTCFDTTAYCNSPAAGVGWRPWSYQVVGAWNVAPEVVAAERGSVLEMRTADFPGISSKTRRMLRNDIRSANRALAQGRYDQARSAAEDYAGVACTLSDDARQELRARAETFLFYLRQPELCSDCTMPVFTDPLCP